VEVGFISNAQDAKDMVSPTWRQSMAEAIVRGILDYVRLSR
jgi:N-acetylmuramoyl-L-alanine amidase